MTTTHIIFDWGDTLMRDFPEKQGPMALWETIEVIPNVNKTLQILSRKYILAVATNAGASDTSLMKNALQRGNIAKHFSYFFSSKDLGYAKPDPRFFLEICNQMLVDSSKCAFVGNDYKKDIEGASSTGMKAIFFNHTHLQQNYFTAHKIIFQFDELLQIF